MTVSLVVRDPSLVSSRFVAMFPGQLSEKAGMGEALAHRYEFASALFEEISTRSGVNIFGTFFGEGSPSLHDDLPAQVGVFAVSLAALETLRRIHELEPAASVGYSLGTYAAFVAAGSLEMWAALDVLLEAQRLMADARRRGELEGGMGYVIGLARPVVEDMLRAVAPDASRLAIATENAAAQFVFSGERALVASAVDSFRPVALKTDLLSIGIPMHSRQLSATCSRLQNFLERGVGVKKPLSPLYAPMVGRRVESAEEASDILSKQISSPSFFGPTLKVMRDPGLRRFVEVGPGDVLTKLVRWTVRDALVPKQALEDPSTIEAFAKELAPPSLFSFNENSKGGRAPALQGTNGSDAE